MVDNIPGLIESLSDRISPSLCVGPAPRTMEDLEYLKSLQVTGVLNVSHQEFKIELTLTEETKLYGTFVKGRSLTEKDILARLGILYYHIPTVDGKPLRLYNMYKIIETVNKHAESIGNKTNLYIHCNAGMSRSPAAIALIFIGFGHEPDKTLAMIERMHPQTIIAPDIWRSIIKNSKKLEGKTRIWWQTKEDKK